MSGGGGGGGDTQTVTEKADPWEGVQPYLKDFYSRAQNYSKSTPQQYPWYPEDPVVDYRNPYYNQSTDIIRNSLGGVADTQTQFVAPFQGVTNAYADALVNPSAGWNEVLFGMPAYLTGADYMAQAYNPNEGPLEQQISNFRVNAEDQLARQQLANQDMSIGTGNLGGSRDVMGEMLLDVQGNRAINDAETNMRMQAQQQKNQYGMNALNSALGFGAGLGGDQASFLGDAGRSQMGMFAMAPSIYGFNQSNYLAPYQTMADYGTFVGGLGQDLNAYEQSLLNNDISRFEYNRDYTRDRLNELGAWLSGAGNLGGTSTATTSGLGGNTFQDALGLGSLGLGAYNSGLFSGLGGGLGSGGGITSFSLPFLSSGVAGTMMGGINPLMFMP